MLSVTVCKSLTAQRITRNSCIHLDVAIGLLSCKVSQRWEGTLTSLNLLHRRMKLQPCMAYPRCHGEMFLGKLWHQVMWYKANVLEIAWRRKSCFVGPGNKSEGGNYCNIAQKNLPAYLVHFIVQPLTQRRNSSASETAHKLLTPLHTLVQVRGVCTPVSFDLNYVIPCFTKQKCSCFCHVSSLK